MRMSEHLKAQGVRPSRILHSPTTRTQQTAEILGEVFGVAPVEEKALGFMGDEAELLKKIPDPALDETIIMVGHAPTLMHFAYLLTNRGSLNELLKSSGTLILTFDESIGFGKAKFIEYIKPF